MLLLSKLFFWLSAGLGALSSLASGWEALMVPGGGGRRQEEGGGAGRVKEALKERSVLSQSRDVSPVLTLVCWWA